MLDCHHQRAHPSLVYKHRTARWARFVSAASVRPEITGRAREFIGECTDVDKPVRDGVSKGDKGAPREGGTRDVGE